MIFSIGVGLIILGLLFLTKWSPNREWVTKDHWMDHIGIFCLYVGLGCCMVSLAILSWRTLP